MPSIVGIPMSAVIGLIPALDQKANDSEVVHLDGTETIIGAKTFSPGNNIGLVVDQSAASITSPNSKPVFKAVRSSSYLQPFLACIDHSGTQRGAFYAGSGGVFHIGSDGDTPWCQFALTGITTASVILGGDTRLYRGMTKTLYLDDAAAGAANLRVVGLVAATTVETGSLASSSGNLTVNAPNGSNLNLQNGGTTFANVTAQGFGVVSGHFLARTDASPDIGGVSNRFRNLYMSGTGTFGDNVSITGGTTGAALTISGAAATYPVTDKPVLSLSRGGSYQQPLIMVSSGYGMFTSGTNIFFGATGNDNGLLLDNTSVTTGRNLKAYTDATYDIGASGANRFRDLYLSRNANIQGTLISVGTITVGDVNYFQWFGRSRMSSPADSQFLWESSLGTDLMAFNASLTSASLGTSNVLHLPNAQLDGALYIGAAEVIDSSGNIIAPQSQFMRWNNRSRISSPADGELLWEKNDGTDLMRFNASSASASLGTTNYLHLPNIQLDGDSEYSTIGKGPIIKSPDGVRWRLTVDNAGTSAMIAA